MMIECVSGVIAQRSNQVKRLPKIGGTIKERMPIQVSLDQWMYSSDIRLTGMPVF